MNAGRPPLAIPNFGESPFERALGMVRYLREHCPWDAKQTPASLIPHLLEEAQETAEAIRAEAWSDVELELGDLMLNLAFQIVLGEEDRRLTGASVVERLEEKMVRRHPHLFGGEQGPGWEEMKVEERATASPTKALPSQAASVFEGLPRGLDPLLRAHRIQDRVSGVGFDWRDAAGALAKAREELDEVEEALNAGAAQDKVEEELGDLLFSVINLVRLAGSHSDSTLTRANHKFVRRFELLQELARKRGIAIEEAGLNALDGLWDEVKAGEESARASIPGLDVDDV